MAQFLNVYNFIPFPEKKAEHYQDTDKHTGVITYTITTKTPLFIPNTSNEDAFKLMTDPDKRGSIEKHKSYDFYSYREMNESEDYSNKPAVPVIPGSELRGMVRNIYETLTDSCMGVLNGENVPVIRPGTSTFSPGLLVRKENQEYELEEAFSYRYVDQEEPGRKIYLTNEYCEGQKVYIETGKKVTTKVIRGEEKKITTFYAKQCSDAERGRCNIPGYIIKGISDGTFNKKRGVRIFSQKNNGKTTSISTEDIKRLEAVIKSYREQAGENENCYAEYEQCLIDFQKNKGEDRLPVYYASLDNGKLLYLSPACITKELSHYSIRDLAGDMNPCKETENCCPACDLFGRIGANNEESKASKIRFSDAQVERKTDLKEYYSDITTLPALAEPKLGCAEFYLQKPGDNAKFWTYDYYINSDREGKNQIIAKKAILRGRKFYWHQANAKLPENVTKTNLNKTVRPVKENITFVGKVYFDNISNTQLQQLKWILNCGKNGSNLAYKLGSGKPLGMGSVECKLTSIQERKIALKDGNLEYQEIPMNLQLDAYEDLKFTESSKDAFWLISNYKAIECMKENNTKVVISYPITENQYKELDKNNQSGGITEGYKWFVENHSGWRVKPRGHAVREALPELKFDRDGKLIGSLVMKCHKDVETK